MEKTDPMGIERESFAIITRELDGRLPAEPIASGVKRVIHTTADFEYARSLHFSEGVVGKAVRALQGGADIVTDTQMASAGISKAALQKSGGSLHCFMADADVAQEAARRGITRAAVCMERAAAIRKPFLVAVGNAPTALIRLCELMEEGVVRPEVVIGVPVGFVNVVESKERMIKLGADCIVARGRKGGSNVAAAIVNALLYLAFPRGAQ